MRYLALFLKYVCKINCLTSYMFVNARTCIQDMSVIISGPLSLFIWESAPPIVPVPSYLATKVSWLEKMTSVNKVSSKIWARNTERIARKQWRLRVKDYVIGPWLGRPWWSSRSSSERTDSGEEGTWKSAAGNLRVREFKAFPLGVLAQQWQNPGRKVFKSLINSLEPLQTYI